MKYAIARLTFDVVTECPECGRVIDLIDNDDGVVTTPIFTNKWDELKGYDVYCECGCEFKLSELEY